MSEPLFSLLVPTRNRAALLREALPTVIDQTFDDYEIVVSDNNSEDDTKEVIESFMKECPRIRYVNPGKDLSMCAHFDYIYEQARGQYISYVSDDDGLTPTALEISRQVIEEHDVSILMWSYGGYYHQDIPEKAQRGRMWGRVGTGDLYEIDSKLSIDAYLDFQIQASWNVVPKMLRSVVRRDLVKECAAKSDGQFHLPPFPDHSASCQLMANFERYHLLDLPLYLVGVSYNSNAGIRYKRKAKYTEYFSMFDHDPLQKVPYAQRYINASYFFAGIQRFKDLYPEKFEGDINVDNYLSMALDELLGFQVFEDVSEELDALKASMRTHSGGDAFYEDCLRDSKERLRSATLKRKMLNMALASPQLVRLMMSGRRTLATMRGQRSLDYPDVPSMKRATEIAQAAFGEHYTPGKPIEKKVVKSREELFRLG